MLDESTPDLGSNDLPRFARGYLLADARIEPPVPGWVSDTAPGLWIWRAPEVPLTAARAGRRFVVVLGNLVDTETWCAIEASVNRAAQALARSEEAFLDVTDAWSGRYLVCFGSASSRHLMTDATGMRSAFYSLDGPFVLASHASLVARWSAAEWHPLTRAYQEFRRARRSRLVLAMPGRSTPWSGVVHLTANTILDIEARRLRRVFPRNPIPILSPVDASKLIAPRLRRQVTALVDSGRPVALSMTAGVDSRVSVAASRQVQTAVRYFTYRRRDLLGNDNDVATAQSMARTLRLSHAVLQIPPTVEPPRLDEVIREATFLSHGRRNVSAYRAAFPPDTIHVRSNIGEVGRCYYRRTRAGVGMPASPRDVTARDLARLWGGEAVPGVLVEAFEEWIAATGFQAVRDVDALDLFYWEHRMSCWHSNVVLESDFAFDTHVLFNCRWILERLLAVPLEDRLHASAFTQLVTDLWPGLAAWPMDPRTFPSKRPRRTRLGRRCHAIIAGLRRRIVCRPSRRP